VPDEEVGTVVPVLDQQLGGFDELSDRGEDAVLEPLLSELGEPAFGEVERRRRGG
jgi:hypothetical protein